VSDDYRIALRLFDSPDVRELAYRRITELINRRSQVMDPLFDCRCAIVKVGGKPTGSRNWNPDCPVHPWDERLQAQSDRAVEMQRRAREARKAAKGE
jgi:hypothetical protein